MLHIRLGPWEYRLVRGLPLKAGEYTLYPFVRMISWRHRRAIIGQSSIEMSGRGIVRLEPVAIVTEQAGVRRLIPILDWTRVILWALVGVCMVSWWGARQAYQTLDNYDKENVYLTSSR